MVYLGFKQPQALSERDRAFLQGCLEEIKWPVLQSAETDRADGLANVLAHLHGLSVALNGAIGPHEVARVALDAVMSVVCADSGTVRRLTEDATRFELLFSRGHSEKAIAELQSYAAEERTGMNQAIQTGEPVFLESADDLRASGLSLHSLAAEGYQAWAIVPLIVEGKPVGGLGVSFLKRREFSVTERTFMMNVAEQCAMALHRSLLLEAERAASSELKAEHMRLQQIIDVIPLGILVVRGGRYVLQNTAARAMLGTDLLGVPVPAREQLTYNVARSGGESYSAGELPVERSLTVGEVVIGEQLEITAPGAPEAQTLLCSSVPLRDANNEIAGAVAVLAQISDLKKAEKRRNNLVAKMTHDVKNPLASIKLLSALAERRARKGGSDPADLAEYFQTLQAITARALNVLNDMMQLTRRELGLPLQLIKEECDLGQLAQVLVSEHQLTTDTLQLRLVTPDEPVLGLWDRQALSSVLDNLISNSIKYSPAGGDIVVTVSKDGHDVSGWATVSVKDNGAGIAPEDLPHIFDAFYRAQHTAGVEGTGLGLWAVKEIVEAHGGSVGVESELGQGSVFTVRLPLRATT